MDTREKPTNTELVLLAYTFAALHAASVVLLVTGALLALRWRRVVPVHAAVSAVIVAVHVAGADCPLTTWERALRERAGADYDGGFLDHYLLGPLGLVDHPAVTEVIYPGLDTHPGHELASRQMTGFGGMVSFRTGSRETALAVCARARVFTLAESLGGVESLIEHPGEMTHASVAGSALEVPDDLVRLSVGIEDVADLVADLGQALA